MSAGATLLCSYLGLLFLSVFAGSICIFIIFFFRDPERKKVADYKAVLAPADGTIAVSYTHLTLPTILLV